MNSPIELATTIDGVLPDKYAFYDKPGRSFRTEFASTNQEYSVVLFERTDERNYENCYARGLFVNLDLLAKVIRLWVGEQMGISEIKVDFEELELYEDFEYQNSNPTIDKAWTKVKNMVFNDTGFWKDIEWNNRYFEMLTEAKKHKAFQRYFPFTSHYWLRFSIDSELKETWTLDTYIIPVMYSKEVPPSLGKYYVSYNNQPMGGRFFEGLKDALDFYANKLEEIKPRNWVTKK